MSDEHHGPIEPVLQGNIRAIVEARARFERRKTGQERLADGITSFAGSMKFVLLHAVLLVLWFVVNTGSIPGVEPFDPYPFVMLAMIASVEAIFLSTFVLVSQNRMQALADQRADLNLQISLLAEREATTLLHMVDEIRQRLGIHDESPDLDELKQIVTPAEVLDHIEGVREKGVP